jgi:hypothetical protein
MPVLKRCRRKPTYVSSLPTDVWLIMYLRSDGCCRPSMEFPVPHLSKIDAEDRMREIAKKVGFAITSYSVARYSFYEQQ